VSQAATSTTAAQMIGLSRIKASQAQQG
jgi:hypothetical protein